MKKQAVEALATGFYIGKIPFMPGTFGTLLGMPLAWWLAQNGPVSYMICTVACIFAAVAVAEWHELFTGQHDNGSVVIDEVVGYLVAMTWMPLTWQAFLGAFVLFRFFDILKPFPISYMDQKIRGGFGCVLDDVAAGLVSNVVLQIVYTHTSLLGGSLHVVGG